MEPKCCDQIKEIYKEIKGGKCCRGVLGQRERDREKRCGRQRARERERESALTYSISIAYFIMQKRWVAEKEAVSCSCHIPDTHYRKKI